MRGPLRIEPIDGYTPAIGRLVGMLSYARSTTLAAVAGLTLRDLDHTHDAESNSIGALLAHMAAVERSYQVMTFEGRLLSADEQERWASALTLGAAGRQALRGRPLEHYLDELAAARQDTLHALAERDDEWLERSVGPAPAINAHWAWFHVAEDEINHRGQIRWLRARLPKDEPVKAPVSTTGAEHYTWGANADGWHLLRSAGLSVIQERMPPGTAETRHRHAAARQFFFVLAGRLAIEVDGTDHAVGPHEGLEIPPGHAHEVRNDAGEPAEFLVVSQPPSHGDRIPAPTAE